MTCPDCQGPVDVVTMNGAAIRCGCGHTTITAPPRPAQAVHADLQSLLNILRENRVQTYKAGEVEITLSADAWKTESAPANEPIPPDDNCACGHAYHDHNPSGCVHGCDIDSCGKPGEKAA